MNHRTTLLALALVIAPLAQAQTPLQLSHIEANVPDASAFEPILKRDLLAYFTTGFAVVPDRVEVRLLREAPTQSGVSYPKYYAWVRVFAGQSLLQQGAIRLVAIEKLRFEVTDFVSRSQIQANGGGLESVFPAALVPGILQLAAAS